MTDTLYFNHPLSEEEALVLTSLPELTADGLLTALIDERRHTTPDIPFTAYREGVSFTTTWLPPEQSAETFYSGCWEVVVMDSALMEFDEYPCGRGLTPSLAFNAALLAYRETIDVITEEWDSV